jgi:hypothetical protein
MTYLQFNAWVTHERLDDEVIAINLETGAYFALDGTAADAWTLAAAGSSTDDIVTALAARYEKAPATIPADVSAFVAELVEQGLASETADAPTPADDAAPLPTGGNARREYLPPSLLRYDDLADLLLLDPIHEVDDVGWPIARTE